MNYLIKAIKELDIPKYYTPKSVVNHIKIQSIYGNPKYKVNKKATTDSRQASFLKCI
jgi:hypothetical protein